MCMLGVLELGLGWWKLVVEAVVRVMARTPLDQHQAAVLFSGSFVSVPDLFNLSTSLVGGEKFDCWATSLQLHMM